MATGSVHADLNPVFRGLSPKGTWRLVWWDTSQDAKTRTTGQRPSRSGQARSTPRSRELESSDGNPFVQSFKLSGKKVQKKQVPGVNVTVNSAGSDPGANRQLRAKLISPGGDSVTVLDGPGNQSLVNLTYDDQSELQLCDPNGLEASDCNFVQGVTAPDTGFYTGFTHGFLNPVFRGGNPRGTWRLVWWDTSSVTTHEIGTAILTVRTGKKFAKR
ncbi:MAG: hypothetical protein ACXWYV_08240 [Solirubrobacterales bacterium]